MLIGKIVQFLIVLYCIVVACPYPQNIAGIFAEIFMINGPRNGSSKNGYYYAEEGGSFKTAQIEQYPTITLGATIFI